MELGSFKFSPGESFKVYPGDFTAHKLLKRTGQKLAPVKMVNFAGDFALFDFDFDSGRSSSPGCRRLAHSPHCSGGESTHHCCQSCKMSFLLHRVNLSNQVLPHKKCLEYFYIDISAIFATFRNSDCCIHSHNLYDIQ